MASKKDTISGVGVGMKNRNPRAINTPEEKTTTAAKKPVGRPKKKEPCENINIAVPVRLLNKWNEVKKAVGGNQTAYVVSLIEKDMRDNYDNYKQILDIQEKMGL